jgi:hypothetical protein
MLGVLIEVFGFYKVAALRCFTSARKVSLIGFWIRGNGHTATTISWSRAPRRLFARPV